MAEREELIQRSGESKYKRYGAVPSSREEDEDEHLERPVRCICTRRDCVLVTVLSILIVASIITSLVIGIPSIRNKQTLKISMLAQKNMVDPATSSNFPSASSNANIQKRAAILTNKSLCNEFGLCAR